MGLAPLAASAGVPLKIASVQAYPIPLLPTSRFGTANFKSDYDPARWRWFGPFSQLAGSMMVEIRTTRGSPDTDSAAEEAREHTSSITTCAIF